MSSPRTLTQGKSSAPSRKAPKAKPSPQEIEAIRAARAEKKARIAADPILSGKQKFAPRQWLPVVSDAQRELGKRSSVRILSWNILAQGLVRRKLFPGSDCLKWPERMPILDAELDPDSHAWDVACFQEVDRMEHHSETFSRAGFSWSYEKGYESKQHGLLIAWRSRLPDHSAGEGQPEPSSTAETKSRTTFESAPIAKRIVYYDQVEACKYFHGASSDTSPTTSTSGSRSTRNIAQIVALRLATDASGARVTGEPTSGLIVATTHLFWHPSHAYERVRQAGILLQEAYAFRREHKEIAKWDIVIAGDFNDQPHSATYHLMSGLPPSREAIEEVQRSTVVHSSIDEAKRRDAEAHAIAQGIEHVEHAGARTGSGEMDTESGQEEAEGDEASEDGGENDDEQEDIAGPEDASTTMLKGCRAARQEDGLLTLEALASLFASPGHEAAGSSTVRSAYGHAFNRLKSLDGSEAMVENYFSSVSRGRERFDDETWYEGKRNEHASLPAGHPGRDEPMWTLYSSIFSLTLDYIWLLPNPLRSQSTEERKEADRQDAYPHITALLAMLRTKDLAPGIPRKGVCASDHVAIGAEIELR
ncbi:Endonuclease/exonuclease/phosphatase [Ceraceosorus guamensis]|uniref:Endonuclease/exonuclease/phosphatase n=1 Tax=Ceraceosorus guamensis TaxID=1522189 RepID=A0A316W538_9BASI|nr:Endonuclease/exonuclease/phosphatase [Ceraceosorus guamensis]PWN43801.1 Endonuclease/exonuclease/phosphatase [Ceraceosorus guamensis]